MRYLLTFAIFLWTLAIGTGFLLWIAMFLGGKNKPFHRTLIELPGLILAGCAFGISLQILLEMIECFVVCR